MTIDAEGAGMSSVTELLSQLRPNFKAAGLGIAVSVPWPMRGTVNLYGADYNTMWNFAKTAKLATGA